MSKTKVDKGATTQRNKAARQRKHERYGHAPSRKRYGTDWHETKVRTDVTLRTFEDEYREFRRSRGHRGLSYDPAKRPTENIYVGSPEKKNHKLGYRNDIIKGTVRFFPIGECMERPITYNQVIRKLS